MIRKPYTLTSIQYGEVGVFPMDDGIHSISSLDEGGSFFEGFEVKLEDYPTMMNIDGIIQFYGFKNKDNG